MPKVSQIGTQVFDSRSSALSELPSEEILGGPIHLSELILGKYSLSLRLMCGGPIRCYSDSVGHPSLSSTLVF